MEKLDLLLRTLPGAAAAVLTPLVARFLSSMAPPRKAALGEGEHLKQRFGRLEIGAQIACLIGMFASIGGCLAAGKVSPWMIGILFGSMTAAPVALVALATLPRGRSEWDAFWIYYEWKYRIGLSLVFPMYGLLIMIGIVSVFALFI